MLEDSDGGGNFSGKSHFRCDFSRCIRTLLLLLLLTGSAGAESVLVLIIQSSDLHANIDGSREEGAALGEVAWTVKTLRQRHGRENTLYIDTGDTVQGSIAGTLSRGMAPLEFLRKMECEMWVPGNHEFDFGAYRFLELAESMRPWLVCCNLRFGIDGIPPYPPYRIFLRGGMRIAVIGAAASYMDNWFLPSVNRVATATSALQAIRRLMPELRREKPDAVILAIHQGWMGKNDTRGVNEVAAIAREFPEIDLILGGHTHRSIPGNRIAGGVWYVQPPPYGAFLTHVTMEFNRESRRLECITSRLVRPEKGREAPETMELSRYLKQRTAEYAREKIAEAPKRNLLSKGRPGQGNPVSELISAAVAGECGADAVLHGTLSTAGLPSGRPVLREDLFQIVPYENTIVTCEMSREELAEVVAEQWSLRKSYSFNGLYGVRAVVERGGNVKILTEKPRLKVALNSHAAAGSGRTPILKQILAKPENKCSDTGISTRDALEKYIRIHGTDIQTQTWIE